MIYAPVMITTCNRYEHLQRCIASLQKNTDADKTEVYISVDYPPAEKYVEGWKRVCQMLKNPVEGFHRVHVIFQETNLGAEENYGYLEEVVFKEHDRLIFSEDDNEFAVNFLVYMNKGLERFENHPTVYGICGYADDLGFKYGDDNVIALTNFCAWGMGIWREKEKVIHEQLTMRKWLYAAKNMRLMWTIYRRRKRLFSRMLGTIIDPSIEETLLNTDINRGIFLAINGFCTINPTKTKVRNWGWDGSGQNIVGNSEDNKKHVGLELDQIREFEYRIENVKPVLFNDRLLDDNHEWNIERAKWYNDPLTYFVYRLLGRKAFFKITHRGERDDRC